MMMSPKQTDVETVSLKGLDKLYAKLRGQGQDREQGPVLDWWGSKGWELAEYHWNDSGVVYVFKQAY